jgi:hypothetical protein
MIPLLVRVVILVLCFSTEGIAADQQPAQDPSAIPPEDQEVIEMLDILELMELAEYMDMMQDLKPTGDGEDDAKKK